MFVRAKLSQVTVRNAILAPQQGVRDPRGRATVMLVGKDNRRAPHRHGRPHHRRQVLVTAGLSPGDKVITEGLDRLPGSAVRPLPAGSPPSAPVRGR